MMAINPINSDPIPPSENITKPSNRPSNAPVAHSSTASSTSQSKNTGDPVNLSDKQKEFEDLIDAIKQVPDIRQEKVEKFRKAIEAGQYRIPSKEIADRIIQDTVANRTHKSK